MFNKKREPEVFRATVNRKYSSRGGSLGHLESLIAEAKADGVPALAKARPRWDYVDGYSETRVSLECTWCVDVPKS